MVSNVVSDVAPYIVSDPGNPSIKCAWWLLTSEVCPAVILCADGVAGCLAGSTAKGLALCCASACRSRILVLNSLSVLSLPVPSCGLWLDNMWSMVNCRRIQADRLVGSLRSSHQWCLARTVSDCFCDFFTGRSAEPCMPNFPAQQLFF